MKKKYETPKAELVIFDYRESVTACSDFGWWWGFCIWKCPQNTQPQENQGTENPNNRNKNSYYAPGWGLHCS